MKPPLSEEQILADLKNNVVVVGREYLFVRPSFFSDDASTEWREYSFTQFRDTFSACGYSKKAANAMLSLLHMDENAMYVSHNRVFESYPLHPAGYQLIGGKPCFIRTGWNPLAPQKGSPQPVIRQILRMFGPQADIFLGWLQGALMRQLNYRAQIAGKELPYPPLASQTLCLCGKQGCGKTRVLLSCIIAELLGSYTAIPASWYNGKSKFGDWLLAASVYVADDCEPLMGYRDRVAFASRLKSLGYPERISCECKGKASIDITFPNERICLANLKQGAIGSLPDTSVDGDKFLALYICGPAGVNADYAGNFMLMDAALRQAIPAFAYWLLNEYTIPTWALGSASRRHSVMNLGENLGYVAPQIRRATAEMDQAGILIARLRRLHANPYYSKSEWYSQSQLRQALESSNGEASMQCYSEEFTSLLNECIERWPKLIEKKRYTTGMKYRLKYSDDFDLELQNTQASDFGATYNHTLLNLVGLSQQDIEAGFTSTQNQIH